MFFFRAIFPQFRGGEQEKMKSPAAFADSVLERGRDDPRVLPCAACNDATIYPSLAPPRKSSGPARAVVVAVR